VAKALAERFEVTLVYCFEKAGVLKDPDDDGSVIPLITKDSFASLVADGTVAGGMIPKLQNALDALEGGVSEVRITRADAPEGGTRILL
jgi:acetylglutamate kinase